tara:strand:+ start:803 stop:979 length:177 start_codon:yes stop_codon:yes gene_type:complete
MYAVKNDLNGDTVALCSLLRDAEIIAKKDFDGTTFTIETITAHNVQEVYDECSSDEVP